MQNDKNIYERIVKLFTQVMTLVMAGKRDANKVANALQAILVESAQKFELYLVPGQEVDKALSGLDVERHLIETGRIKRAVSRDDPQVKMWLANPETYPEEYWGKQVFLWSSVEEEKDGSGVRGVAYLRGAGGMIYLTREWIEISWHSDGPALLRAE